MDNGFEPTAFTLKPESKLCETARVIILLRASITIAKRRGDRGSPCRIPRELPKKPTKVP